jgi:hypothetical protein
MILFGFLAMWTLIFRADHRHHSGVRPGYFHLPILPFTLVGRLRLLQFDSVGLALLGPALAMNGQFSTDRI